MRGLAVIITSKIEAERQKNRKTDKEIEPTKGQMREHKEGG